MSKIDKKKSQINMLYVSQVTIIYHNTQQLEDNIQMSGLLPFVFIVGINLKASPVYTKPGINHC